jgi:peroxiredoxin
MYGRTYMGIIRSHFVIDTQGNLEDVRYKISPQKSIEEALKRLE